MSFRLFHSIGKQVPKVVNFFIRETFVLFFRLYILIHPPQPQFGRNKQGTKHFEVSICNFVQLYPSLKPFKKIAYWLLYPSAFHW